MLTRTCFPLFWSLAVAQTWCNKNYLPGQPVEPPGQRFPIPETSQQPLLVFSCAPILTPYVDGEDAVAGILVEATLVHSRWVGAKAIDDSEVDLLNVSISFEGAILASSSLALNSSVEILFPFVNLGTSPRMQPFSIDCVATASQTDFHASAQLAYLPSPGSGSVTKRDSRTGALLVRKGALYETIFPFGFYTSFDNYLDSNLSLLDEIKQQGFNIVHPVPTFGDLATLERVLDRMEALGLYLVYDMRHTYRDPTAQVNAIKHRPNLLLWYTADEPDGTSTPPSEPIDAYAAIQTLDPYHPVSLALNCADYAFSEYVLGADVIMPDTYPVAVNTSFSAKYNTTCTSDFGCCGCDNCEGRLDDVARRLDDFGFRLQALGLNRQKTLWAVPQAFGASEFWTRPPTGREFLVQAIVSINHGARGIMPWIDPTPADVKHSAAALATVLSSRRVSTFIFNPRAVFINQVINRVDMGIWTVEEESLVLVANLNEEPAATIIPVRHAFELEELLVEGVTMSGASQLQMSSLGTAILVSRPKKLAFIPQGDDL